MDTPIKVAFYILPDANLKARDLYACRLIEKAYNTNHRVYILAVNLAEAQNIDTQLWTFRDISFIPHAIYNNEPNGETPVLIGYNSVPPKHNDVLVNLTNEIPKFYTQFKHIIELIQNEEAAKKTGRAHYSYYKNQHHQIETYNI